MATPCEDKHPTTDQIRRCALIVSCTFFAATSSVDWYARWRQEVSRPGGTQPYPSSPPGSKNHQSANRHLNVVIKSVRRGQDAGQYLVLSDKVISCLDAVHISPLGVVAKKDTDSQLEVRLIYDLSFPRGRSANEASDKEHFPQIEYQHVTAIARRIESLSNKYPGQAICILKGDVRSAFRHLMLASPHVLRMGARIPQLQALLLDMAAPFGWSGSPSYYGAFGGAISWLLGCESPSSMSGGASPDSVPFFAYEWVDDHVLVEVDTPMRLRLAQETLRMAMLAVLGPRAINEEKFSTWATNIEVLGLVFDTRLRTVSMPPSKISKALARVTRLASSPTVSRSDLQQLLRSLRHVCCCLRAAKPFFQRVHSAAKRAPRRGRVQLTSAVRCDLQWFRSILVHGQWSGLPLAMFCELPPASVHLYMDSSNEDLAVLEPANRRYIQFQFDDEERASFTKVNATTGFDINVHKLFCAALAAVLWGHGWTPPDPNQVTHVRAWSDNASAVAWINKLISDHPLGQELIRDIGFSEATHRFRLSARHLPGSANIVADTGTRCNSSPSHHQETVHNVLEQLQAQALAVGSHRKYAATWRQRTSWCAAEGLSPWLSGVRSRDSEQLIQVAIWCWQPRAGHRRNSAPTIMSKLGHISWYRRRYRGFPVGLHAGHQLALQGMQRLSAPPSRKNPITPDLLRRLRARCNFRSAHGRVLWGASVMGYFYMLRRSEYLSCRGILKPYAIQLQDVKFRTQYGALARSRAQAYSVPIHFRGSKTDQEGQGMTRTLERSGSRWLCPVLAVWELVQHARHIGVQEHGALCSVSKQLTVSAAEMTAAIRSAAQDAGENPDHYGTHSMRSGGATALFAAGIDRLAIKHLGRWRSDYYEQYARIDNVTVKDIAAAMASGTKHPPSRQGRLRHNGAPPRRNPHGVA